MAMKVIFMHLWNRRTTVFGYLQVILGVLAVSDGIFSPTTLKWVILSNAVLLACLGHYNNLALKRAQQ